MRPARTGESSSGRAADGASEARSETEAITASDSTYAPVWHFSNERDAIHQIYITDSEDVFEEAGKWDSGRFLPWLNDDSIVLDLGCGVGRVARYVIPHCAQLWAVDVSQSMLDMMAQRLDHPANVRYVLCQDVSFAEVPSESVDLAYALLVLQHLEREDAFLLLEELRRVIKPDGTVILTYPNLLSATYQTSFIEYARNRSSGEKGRARFYTPQEVEVLLKAAGFRADIDPQVEIWVVARPV